MPTGIWSSRLRSGSAHCDLEVPVEVRQCPLRSGSAPLGSGARGGGPAVPTGIWTARRRRRVRRQRRQRRKRRRRAPLKSSNPHLAGGEIYIYIIPGILPLAFTIKIPKSAPIHHRLRAPFEHLQGPSPHGHLAQDAHAGGAGDDVREVTCLARTRVLRVVSSGYIVVVSSG